MLAHFFTSFGIHLITFKLHYYTAVTPDWTWPPRLLTCMVDAVASWLGHIEISSDRQNNRACREVSMDAVPWIPKVSEGLRSKQEVDLVDAKNLRPVPSS